MSKTKVKRDSHGLYVRGAGYIWRYEFPRGYDHAYGLEPSLFKEGDTVSVSHSGGPIGSISGEKWFCHGTYFKFGEFGAPMEKGYIPSDEVYRPTYHQWRDEICETQWATSPT